MEKIYLDCLLREEKGKNKVTALRRGGFVPAVVYGQGKKTLPLKLDRSQFIKFIHSHHGIENMIITLRIDSEKKTKEEKAVLIKEMQIHPVHEDILHVDFNEVSLTKLLRIKVPIHAKGDAIGVKQDGGTLTHVMWELEVECLPTSIPEKIEIEVANMKIGDMVLVKDLVVPEGVKVLADKEAIVFTLVPPKKEEVVVEAPVEGAAPAEPEVIKEKKEKPEEGEEAPAEEKKPKEEKKPEAPGKKS
jgi:large subunit ribosomal protein L25